MVKTAESDKGPNPHQSRGRWRFRSRRPPPRRSAGPLGARPPSALLPLGAHDYDRVMRSPAPWPLSKEPPPLAATTSSKRSATAAPGPCPRKKPSTFRGLEGDLSTNGWRRKWNRSRRWRNSGRASARNRRYRVAAVIAQSPLRGIAANQRQRALARGSVPMSALRRGTARHDPSRRDILQFSLISCAAWLKFCVGRIYNYTERYGYYLSSRLILCMWHIYCLVRWHPGVRRM
jgi:hypothetical protein